MVALRSAYSKQTIAGKPEENRHYLFCSKYSDNAVRKLYLVLFEAKFAFTKSTYPILQPA